MFPNRRWNEVIYRKTKSLEKLAIKIDKMSKNFKRLSHWYGHEKKKPWNFPTDPTTLESSLIICYNVVLNIHLPKNFPVYSQTVP